MTDTKERPRAFWPRFWVIALLLGGLIWLEGERQRAMALTQERLASLSAEANAREELQGVRSAYDTLDEEVGRLRSGLAAEKQRSERSAEGVEQRLAEAEERLGTMGSTIEAHSSRLAGLIDDSLAGGALATALAEHDAAVLDGVQERWSALSARLSSTRDLVDRSTGRLDRLDHELNTPRDLDQLWREIVGPVVQLAGDTSVGSGVLLPSEQLDDGAGYRTYLLTAWHVVRDIQGDLSRQDAPVPTTVYLQDSSTRSEQAKLLCFDAGLDAALLELVTPDALPCGARLPSRAHLLDLHIFDGVYAVGCPLGNDPIPTRGEIATLRHQIDGHTYWMINAPTYIGNSGGGVYELDRRELIGIFSKIYTHGSIRPTIVPHMGLATPMLVFYDWLESQGHGDLVPPDEESMAHVASASTH